MNTFNNTKGDEVILGLNFQKRQRLEIFSQQVKMYLGKLEKQI